MAFADGPLRIAAVNFWGTPGLCRRGQIIHSDRIWKLAGDSEDVLGGCGYATEAAEAALADAFGRVGLTEVLAYTGPDNLRSQAVMTRLRLQRDPARDYTYEIALVVGAHLVWVARPSNP